MKTKSKLLVYLFLFFAVFGCKKQDLINESSLIENSISGKVRSWLESQPAFVNYQKVKAGNMVIDVPEKIEWEKSEYFAHSNTIITPVNVGNAKKGQSGYKFLAAELYETGNIKKANYYNVLIDRNETDLPVNSFITPELVKLKKIPAEFTGSIIQYDILNTEIFSMYYHKGVLNNKTGKVVAKSSMTAGLRNGVKDDAEPGPENPPLPEGCSYVSIDWYWQVYVNGVLVYEEYLYTSTVVVCEGGNEPGGGGGSPTCEQQNENFINQGVAVSGLVYTLPGGHNGTIWIRNYNWPIFTAATWGLLSYEKGTLVKVHYQNFERWEFQSFEHIRITEVGTVFGGTRTYEDLGATINITPPRTSAWVQIDFKVKSKVLCWPLPAVAILYNANKTFYAPNTVVVLPPE